MAKTKKQKRMEAKRKRQERAHIHANMANAPTALDFGGEVVIAAAEAGEGASLPRFSMTVYTGGAIRPDATGKLAKHPIVVAIDGIQGTDRRRPILFNHDQNSGVGHTERIYAENGQLFAEGTISGTGSAASEVLSSSRNGFPWQASFGLNITRAEFVPARKSVEVNGQRFNGPLYVARQSTLREISFVSVGADDNSSATVAATERQAMNFSEWLEQQGVDSATLTASQLSFYQQTFEALQAANSGEFPTVPADLEGPEEIATEPEAGAVTATATIDPNQLNLAVGDAVNDVLARRSNIEALTEEHPTIRASAFENNWDAERTELEVLRANRGIAPSTIHSENGDGSYAETVEAALMLGYSNYSESEIGEQHSERAMNEALSARMQGYSLAALVGEMASRGGMHVSPGGRITDDHIRAAFRADQQLQLTANSGFSTISLSGILSNIANKSLLTAYNAVDPIIERLAATRNVNDFKQHTSYRMTGVGLFEELGPSGEIKHMELSEESYTNQAKTYARMLTLTRTMMINDDLGAFLQIPRAIGRAAALKMQELFWTLLLSNPGSFFSAGNNNLLTGANSALDIASLTSAEQLFLDQTDSEGKPVLVIPSILVVPTSLKVTAEQLMRETKVNETTTTNKPKPMNNPHAGKFSIESSPYLNSQGITGSSATAWYLFGNPGDIPALEIAYLRGRHTPRMDSSEADFNTLGMQWRGYFDFGVATQDKRGAVKSNGA